MAKDRRWILQYKSPLGDDYIKIYKQYTEAFEFSKHLKSTVYETESTIIEGRIIEDENSTTIFRNDNINIEIFK